jgi:hypothetical protein
MPPRRKTAGLSGTGLILPLEITQSTLSSATGSSSIRPLRTSTHVAP